MRASADALAGRESKPNVERRPPLGPIVRLAVGVPVLGSARGLAGLGSELGCSESPAPAAAARLAA